MPPAAPPSPVPASVPTAAARRLLTGPELSRLHTGAAWRVVVDALAVWGAILASLWLVARFPGPWSVTLAFVVIATRQLALSHLVHEASHRNLGLSGAWNDWISDVFFAAPVLITTRSYREIHEPHHARLGHARDDTDVRAWYRISGWHFLLRSAKSLFGVEAFQTAMSYRRRMAAGGGPDWRHLGLAGATNAALLAYCFWLGIPWAWLALWILPLHTLTVFLLILRVVAEHQPRAYAASGVEDFSRDLIPPLSRSIDPNPLEKFVFAPMSFCYHHEHHLFPGVPYPRLRELHRTLRARGYYEDTPASLGPSYLRVLASLVFPGSASDERTERTDGAVGERGTGLSGL